MSRSDSARSTVTRSIAHPASPSAPPAYSSSSEKQHHAMEEHHRKAAATATAAEAAAKNKLKHEQEQHARHEEAQKATLRRIESERAKAEELQKAIKEQTERHRLMHGHKHLPMKELEVSLTEDEHRYAKLVEQLAQASWHTPALLQEARKLGSLVHEAHVMLVHYRMFDFAHTLTALRRVIVDLDQALHNCFEAYREKDDLKTLVEGDALKEILTAADILLCELHRAVGDAAEDVFSHRVSSSQADVAGFSVHDSDYARRISDNSFAFDWHKTLGDVAVMGTLQMSSQLKLLWQYGHHTGRPGPVIGTALRESFFNAPGAKERLIAIMKNEEWLEFGHCCCEIYKGHTVVATHEDVATRMLHHSNQHNLSTWKHYVQHMMQLCFDIAFAPRNSAHGRFQLKIKLEAACLRLARDGRPCASDAQSAGYKCGFHRVYDSRGLPYTSRETFEETKLGRKIMATRDAHFNAIISCHDRGNFICTCKGVCAAQHTAAYWHS